jgi:alkylation response protein AidB-like acyl-CoA dehydrogenase
LSAALLDHVLAATFEDFLRTRRGSDGSFVRDGLRWLHTPSGALAPGSPATRDACAIARTLATAAWSDMSLAFSLWCHRMVIEYLRAANGDQDGCPHGGGRDDEQREWLGRLERAYAVGSSGLAAAMAHYVGGGPLPIRAALRARERFELTGTLRWASNLFPDEFVLITAADAGPNGKVIVILPAGRAGLEVEKHPVLLDLQATASSSVNLRATLVESTEILATDFDRFVRTVRPAFLLYQASFCWGLAARALCEANALIGKGTNEVFASELRANNSERDRIEEGILENLAAPVTTGAGREIVELRLSAARLAGAASRLESKLAGGAGYTSCSATARRFREAAFLPIQSPTEGQLLWELSSHARSELSR